MNSKNILDIKRTFLKHMGFKSFIDVIDIQNIIHSRNRT